MNTWPDVACDLWIIREWQASEALRSGAISACNAVLAEELDDEQAGYGLPDDYTSGRRLHVFADDDCEVWLGCLNGAWVCPEKALRLFVSMIADPDEAECIAQGGVYVVALDGRQVTAEYRCEVCHGAADAN